MTEEHAVDAGPELSGRRPLRSGHAPARRRWAARVLAALLAGLVVLCCADGALLAARVDRFDVDLSGDGRPDAAGTTWVLVGLDSRADVPATAPAGAFGSPDDVPGSRADVVIVVHLGTEGVTAFSVPRDVVVRRGHSPTRLTLSWLHGPAGLRDALCSLGIPTDHLVSIDLAGFAALVDSAGGLDLDLPEPVRDLRAGLLLPQSGPQHVDGVTALAMVRSRDPEHLVDGQWVAAPADPNGRASTAATLLTGLDRVLHHSVSRPWRLQRVAWAASGAIEVDRGTGIADLVSLARADVAGVSVLPVGSPVGDTLARPATAQTIAAVAAAGMSCDH